MTDIIRVQDLVYQYADAQHPALNGINLRVQRGDWVAVIGHNGSGKSTLAKNLLGLLEPAAGKIEIAGMALSEATVWDIRERVGIVFQNPDNQFVGATVADDVAFSLENRGVPRADMVQRVDAALAKVRMQDFAQREPAHLSGGQKQRVVIAGVVAQKPQILILDEATSMLDPAGRREIVQLIRQLKSEMDLTVLSITHDLEEAASADQVVMLDSGQIVDQGTPEKIFARGTALAEHGLDVPYAERLKAALRARGVVVPDDYLTDEGLVDYLWTLSSTM